MLSRYRMVDITEKEEIFREATAIGKIRLKPETIKRINDRKLEKGDPLAAAEIAAIQAGKNTPQIIPFCHQIPITNIQTKTDLKNNSIEVQVRVRGTAKTGVEMEALVAASIYLLTIWDMVKKYEKDEKGQYPQTFIESIRVKEKIKAR
ncbi:molybdenum cofactor biosynthesis protein MoaC [miscellaneous Crenarchaeota group archaeon SMTZ-80]|nr:MAG: molybdenum cofactor biosynthesis protein MoaC [miscellaneous Crenarchaeota group archaeon SMTZ-80]